VKAQGTLIKVSEDIVRDRTELTIRVRTTKLEKLGVQAKSLVGKENALTISIEN
jgi:hypothetical protein